MPPSTRTTPARCAANDVCAARRVTVVRSGARSGVVMTRASILEVAVRDASASRSACSRQRRRRRRASTRLEVARHLRSPRRRNLHAKLTIVTSLALVATGSLLVAAFEWTNPQTFGKLDGPATVLASLLAGVMPRSGGFSTVSVGQMHEGTWLLDDALMFVGGGSASTAGGIKVTTLAIMLLAILAEARGDRDVEAFGRRIPRESLQVAHLVSGKMLDYIEVEDGFTIVKMRPPRETQGFTIAQSKIRERYGVTVIGVKSPGLDFVHATPRR